ncbi:MAG TPA: protein serine/threonine phosphatase 2C family protein [Proteobacteria bacterium]|nr:protein serine/threonine phosphatase 2C family protein [Pseudomonadota bacterium]
MDIRCEKKGSAAVAWLRGTKHRFYEDRYRLLPREIPLVGRQNRGELFAVFDGMGSAPEGRRAAQEMSDYLLRYYQEPGKYGSSWKDVRQLLLEANQAICDWGFMPGTDRPLGGCAGTVIWIDEGDLFAFHAGDTVALLIRGNEATQLTRLHEIDGGIYRYFGLGANLELDVHHLQLEEYDRILVLSDGVTKAFHPKEAADFVQKHSDLCRAVSELVHVSRVRGSTDDITAILIAVEDFGS